MPRNNQQPGRTPRPDPRENQQRQMSTQQTKSSFAAPLRDYGDQFVTGSWRVDEPAQRGFNSLQPTGPDYMAAFTSEEEATLLTDTNYIPQGFSGSVDDGSPLENMKLTPALLVAGISLLLS